MNSEHRASLEHAASAAPTADNSQPWEFHWRANCLEIWRDSACERPPSDVNFLLTDLGAGACVENIRLRAATLGYDCAIESHPDPGQPALIARVRWQPAAATDSARANAIERRHTNRGFPWRTIDAESMRWLGEPVAAHEPEPPVAVEGRRARRIAHGVLRTAEATRFAERDLHGELFASISFASGWQQNSETGLAPGALAIERPLRPLFKALRHWPLMRTLNAMGGAELMALRSVVLPVACSPSLYLLQSRGLNRREILQAGRALQRFWLAAEAAGLAAQPFAAPGVIAHGGLTLSKRGQRRRQAVADGLANFGSEQRYGLVFIRLGRTSARPNVRSGRRPNSFNEALTRG